jgi:hypothetical protein
MIERNEVKKNSFESKLYDAIDDLKNLDDGNEFVLTNKEIREKLKENLDGQDLPVKAGVFYSSEVGDVSQKRITSTAKSKFKAKSVIKRIDDKAERCLQFEQKYLDRIKSNYESPDKIEIVTLVTDVTLSGDIPTELEGFKGAQKNLIYEKNIMNHINPYQIYDNGPQYSDVANDLNVTKEEHTLPKTVTSVTSVTELPTESANEKVKCPNCNYETERFFMKLHQCPNAPLMLECEICMKNHKKRFRTIDKEDYKNHMLKKHHAGDY